MMMTMMTTGEIGEIGRMGSTVLGLDDDGDSLFTT